MLNILCVITINTQTDVSYQMTLGGAFVYILENQRPEKEVNAQFENWSYVYFVVFMLFISRGPRRPRCNGVAVYISIIAFN